MRVEILNKKEIDQSQARQFDPKIANGMLLEFNIRIVVDKDWYDKSFNDEVIEVGMHDAVATCIFNRIYRKKYNIKP